MTELDKRVSLLQKKKTAALNTLNRRSEEFKQMRASAVVAIDELNKRLDEAEERCQRAVEGAELAQES